ncbi:G-protein coupled receptor 15-like isoform X1 [Anneissia japonica]|uniref:G-protein coupled receptor 15-like isoform X1 n=1 Tax=Anneissia japonica TaxID=1529436 RepID=UPI001425B9C5|nr:G-protein coupled receptor 15-like isoform X1 [Anneissia japonica]XP_033096951.1 G-protein coupled receptor 15-like isoform X1 [Anneissia japonica]XP_033096952.1 G-protein coupled receptor 15-like isoform X1 [Anneissia japonica]XP_033096953.1 G-protein coupled receptor 15-like isoform X1 [Anneissia japonica]
MIMAGTMVTVTDTVTEIMTNITTNGMRNMTTDNVSMETKDGDAGRMPDFTYFYIDSTNEAEFLYTTVAKIIISIIIPIFFIIGILGNLGLLVVFVRIRTLRNSINIYLLNIAACDFCFLATAGPILWTNFSSSPVEDDFYHVGTVACKLSIAVVDACIVVSYWTFMLVTVDRYLSICWPMKFRNIENPKRAVVLCIILWIMVCVYKSPVLYFSTLFNVNLEWVNTTLIDPSTAPSEVAYCLVCDGRPGQPTEDACTIINNLYIGEHIILVGMVPIFVFLYFSMIVCLQRQISKHGQNDVVQAKKHVITMLMLTTLVLLVTTTPARALFLILASKTLMISQTTVVSILYASKCLTFVNASVNPFIYITMSTGYRNAFKTCFLPRACIGDQQNGDDQQRLKSSKATSVLSLNNIGRNNILIQQPNDEAVLN